MNSNAPAEPPLPSKDIESDIGGATRDGVSSDSATTNSEPPTQASLTVAARVAIPLGYALVVAVFVALGIQGDIFARLIRNDPGGVGWAFFLAVIAVVIPLVALAITGSSSSKTSRLFRVVADVMGAALLVAATMIAVNSGVDSYGEREQPIIQLTAGSQNADGAAGLTFASSALSLQTWHRMLLRVVAFSEDTSAEVALAACDDIGATTPNVDGAHLVYWGDVGPSATGTASSAVSVEVSTTDYRYVCALAILSNGSEVQRGDGRFSSTLVDIRQLPEKLVPTPTN
jgi:hypothetical protein